MSLMIAAIDVVEVRHPMRPGRLVVSHAGRHDRSHFVQVTVITGEGTRGYGEAATAALWSGETAAAAGIVAREVLAPLLVGQSFDHPAEALAIMDRAVYQNPFIKSAIDCALWDAWAREQEQSVASLIGDREPLPALPTRASIGAFDVEQTLEVARMFHDAGVRVLKFKTGLPGNLDRQRLGAAREALGDGPIFTVDYNGAFDDAAAAVASIESLLDFNLALVEQPTDRERLTLLAEVRRRVEVPILADEAVFSPGNLEEALALDAMDMLSIYPGKNGGLTHALAMATRAKQAGKPCVIGSNLESDLGQAAMLVLAASHSAFDAQTFAGDFQASLFYASSAVKEPVEMVDGQVRVPTGPGMGVSPWEG